MHKRIIGGLLAAIMMISAGDAFAQRGGPPKRLISKIAGDVYRFQNNFHFSVFMVTPAGIVLTDPLNAPAAKWLKAELKKRFAKPVEAMDFDILAPGHGRMGKKADVAAFRTYMEDLRAAVLQAARTGQSLEQAQNSIKLTKYKDWGQYGRYLKLNIKGMYVHLALTRRGNR
ncbi:MAG: hypothetical protein QGF09_06860 [Rhodospirillales bacterium]|nr:hypothetical protein [Rhodospirillales bacterium]